GKMLLAQRVRRGFEDFARRKVVEVSLRHSPDSFTTPFFPDAVQRETVHRRSGTVPHAECAKVPVQQRTIACSAAPGKRGLNAPIRWLTTVRSSPKRAVGERHRFQCYSGR